MDIYFRLFARPTDVYRTLPATRHPQFCQSHFALDEVEEEGGEEGGKGEVGGAVDERVLGVMRTMEVVMERKISLKNLGFVFSFGFGCFYFMMIISLRLILTVSPTLLNLQTAMLGTSKQFLPSFPQMLSSSNYQMEYIQPQMLLKK